MEGLIVYDSKYGATRQYAEWLGQKLNVPVTIAGSLEKKQIDGPDYLVIGTRNQLFGLQFGNMPKC